MDAQIILGCHGSRRYGISMCRGTTNPVVDLWKLGSEHEEILGHLDRHYKMFDRVLEDLNQINNMLNFLGKYNLMPEHVMKLLYDYIAMHKGCGLYAYVEPVKRGGLNG